MGAKTSISDHLVEEWRPNTLDYIWLSEGLLQGASDLEKQVVVAEVTEAGREHQSVDLPVGVPLPNSFIPLGLLRMVSAVSSLCTMCR